MTVVAVCEDDLILITETPEEMHEVKKFQQTNSRWKKLPYCLGINITQDEENCCIWLHQKQYILNMLSRFGLTEFRSKDHLNPSWFYCQTGKGWWCQQRSDSNCILVNGWKFAVCCHGYMSQHCSSSGSCIKIQLEASSEKDFSISEGNSWFGIKLLKSRNGSLVGYLDVDWGGDSDDRQSTTGNLFLMGGGVISWLSKK